MRYPEITVKLTDRDGNAFSILAKVQRALRKAGVPDTEVDQYLAEAKSGDYDNLLNVTMDWVEVE